MQASQSMHNSHSNAVTDEFIPFSAWILLYFADLKKKNNVSILKEKKRVAERLTMEEWELQLWIADDW